MDAIVVVLLCLIAIKQRFAISYQHDVNYHSYELRNHRTQTRSQLYHLIFLNQSFKILEPKFRYLALVKPRNSLIANRIFANSFMLEFIKKDCSQVLGSLSCKKRLPYQGFIQPLLMSTAFCQRFIMTPIGAPLWALRKKLQNWHLYFASNGPPGT